MPHARVAHVPISDRAAFSLAEVSGLTGLSISGLYLLINRGKLRSPEDTSSRCYLLAFAKVTATYPNVFPATDAIAYEDNSIAQVGILLHEHGIRMSRYRRASIDPNRLASGDAQSEIRPSGLLSTDHEPCASNRVLSPNRIPVHRRVIEPRQRHAGNDVMGKNSVSTFPNRHIFDSRRLHRL